MTYLIEYPEYVDRIEYHGSTIVERTRSRGAELIRRDWLIFDSVEEAQAYFHER